MTNAEVVTAFFNGKPAHSANLSTDGTTIFTYSVVLATKRTCKDGKARLFYNATYYTFTTAKHQAELRDQAADRGYSLLDSTMAFVYPKGYVYYRTDFLSNVPDYLK